MSQSKIQYADKVSSNPQPSIPAHNKVSGDDMTEIKKVVNDNADDVSSLGADVDTKVQSVSGDGVDNTDPKNPIINSPNSPYNKSGVLFEDNFDGTSLDSGWTVKAPLITSVSGGFLNIQDLGGAVFTSYLFRNDKTYTTNYFSCEMEYYLRSTPTDAGVSIGLKHPNGRNYDFRYTHFNGKMQIYYQNATDGSVSSITTNIPLINDKVKLKVIVRGNKCTFQAIKNDILINSLRIDWLTDLSETYKQPNLISPSIGMFGCREIDVNYFKFTDLQKLSPKICFVGDSYTQGFDAIQSEDIWNNKVSDYFNINTSKYSGAGGFSQDILNGIEQVTQNLPENVILMIGVNDVNNAVPLATTQSNITSIVTQLEAVGINVFVCTPELFKAVSPLNDWVRSNFSTQLIDMTGFLAGGGTGNTVVGDLDSATGHPNEFAQTLMSEGVIDYLIDNDVLI